MRDDPILIVDDDSSIRDVVSDLLDMVGYRVITAADGVEALSMIERASPRLVLLDMRMPIMDGWAFARAAAERGIKIPVLVMTAAENAKTWADEIGADGFVAKPFDLDDLVTAVQRLVLAA